MLFRSARILTDGASLIDQRSLLSSRKKGTASQLRGGKELDKIYGREGQPKAFKYKKGEEGKRLDGSPVKQPKPYTGMMPESIRKVLDGEGSMWQRLSLQLGTKLVSKVHPIQKKALDRGIEAVSSKEQGLARGDLVWLQGQSGAAMTHAGMDLGGLKVKIGRAHV